MSGDDFQPAGVRTAVVAGSWYPEEAGHLTSQLEVMLEAAGSWTRCARLRALVVPHAGLRYSGPTAAHGYIGVEPDSYARVVVLAPNHRVPLWGAAVDPSTHYETPLGRMSVDLEAVEGLASQPGFACGTRPFVHEHAIEMQLPFLQLRLPGASLVPVIVGELRGEEFDEVAAGLAPLVDESTLFVVSSDFMHFGDAFGYVPFDDHIPENIRSFDAQAIDAITRAAFDEFQTVLGRTGNTICGRRPLSVFLHLIPRTWKGELRAYTTSGEITGDYTHSVSYAALAFCEGDHEPEQLAEEAEMMVREADRQPVPDSDGISHVSAQRASFSTEEKRTLLRVARRALDSVVRENVDPASMLAGIEVSARLQEPQAVFVSLHHKRGGRLRGCIGWLEPRRPLVEAVLENTCSAATRDPRFEPVVPGEPAGLDIEISVLGPMVEVGDVDEIEVGRDGLLISKQGHRGVLLPQVAVQLGWDRAQFLENICRKAQLPPDAWKQGAQIQRFEAEVFSEAELGES